MSQVIFARPRHNYDSYTDLYRLIELSGYPLVYVDEIDPDSGNAYIVTILNGETQDGWPEAKAEIILWDLEWRVNDPPHIPGVSRVWASDRWYAKQINAQYVAMGSHPGLCDGEVQLGTPFGGVAAMMYTGPYRRNNMIRRLRNAGVMVHDPAWGNERHNRLLKSQAMLHIHQHDNVATVAPLRWALAAAYRLPVISESVAATTSIPGTCWVRYQSMPDLIPTFMRNGAWLRDVGHTLHNLWCHNHTFTRNVEAAL